MGMDPRIVGQVAGLLARSRSAIAKHVVRLAHLVSHEGARAGTPTVTVDQAVRHGRRICQSKAHPGRDVPCDVERRETAVRGGMTTTYEVWACPECGERTRTVASSRGSVRSRWMDRR